MKLIVLHLSDIHINDKDNYDVDNVKRIVATLRPSAIEVEHILVVVSGDLTYSGSQTQFIEAQNFLNELKEMLKETYSLSVIEFAIVPGNHDVDYTKGELGHKDLVEIEKQNRYSSLIDQELQKQKEFFKSAHAFSCFPDSNLLHQRQLSFDGVNIQINLINTASFSSREDDLGYHYLSDSDLMDLEKQNEADYVFTVMHHPYSWFGGRVTDRLEKVLLNKSDVIFVGHKHYETTRVITDVQASAVFLAGGMLSNRGNWDASEFCVGVLDLETRDLLTKKYRCEQNNGIYVEKEVQMIHLSKDRPNSLGITVRKEFLNKEINQDPFNIANTFMNYFVFPLLEEQRDGKDDNVTCVVNNMEGFLAKLNQVKKILISGLNDSGKTALAKAIFCSLFTKSVVLYINGDDVSRNPEQTIKNAFEEIYGREATAYARFQQMDTKNLALIVDDVETIKYTYREKFIDYINENFGLIIETCQQDIELDIVKRIKTKHDRKDYMIFRIEPFYADKRQELVTKVIDIIGHDGRNRENVISALCLSLSRQKTLYNWSPSFIVPFTKYYYNNIGDSMSKDGNVFSKVFESNLVNMVKPYESETLPVDKIFIILDKIAFGICEYREYPLTTKNICQIIEKYNDKFDDVIPEIPFVNKLVAAKIMKRVDKGYLFYEQSYLAYFAAREIHRRIHDGDLTAIQHVLNVSYIHINADILLFVTYIADDLKIIQMLMNKAEEIVLQWEEFSLKPVNISYMRKPVRFDIKPVQESDRQQEEQKHIEIEKEEVKALSLSNDSSIFDGETDELDFIQEMLRCISLMTTLARALPSFAHLMEKEDKKRCVALLYTLPLKIFYKWAKEVDGVQGELIQMIKDFHEWQYRKDKLEPEEIKYAMASHILRWESMSLLLELMNAAFGYATRANTWRYLDAFDYKENTAYGIGHLMSVGHLDLPEQFIEETIRIFNDNDEELAQTMVKRVARNFMVTSKNIKPNGIQQLNAKFFGNQITSTQLIIEQTRNKMKV